MILDSSAVVAVLLREPSHELLIEKMSSADALGIGSPTLVETALVVSSRLSIDCRPMLSEFLHAADALVIPFSEEHFSCACEAYLRFGRGNHPARLNFGDCLSYAVSRVAAQPLLFIGDDFAKTDVAVA